MGEGKARHLDLRREEAIVRGESSDELANNHIGVCAMKDFTQLSAWRSHQAKHLRACMQASRSTASVCFFLYAF